MGEGRERGWERVGSKQQASPAGPFLGPRATGVPKSAKKVATPSGMGSRNFLGDKCFLGRTPTGRERWFGGSLARFGLRALGELPGLGHKQKKRNFPVPGVPKLKKKSHHAVREGCPQLFLPLYVLADRTPTGGNSRNTGPSGHSGPGQPLALRAIPGAG